MFPDFKNKKWAYYGGVGYPVYLTAFLEAPSKIFVRLYGSTCDVATLWRGKNCDWLYDESHLITFAEKFLPELLNKKWAVYDEWLELADKFEKLHYKLVELDLSEVSDEDLRKLAQDYYEDYLTQYSANNWIEPLSIFFQSRLRDFLFEHNIEAKKVDELIFGYGRPVKDNYLKQCAKDFASNRYTLQDLCKKYHYINNDYTGSKPVTEQDIEKILADTMTKDEDLNQRCYESLQQEVEDMLDVFQMTATIQEVRKAYALMWFGGASLLLEELSRRKKVSMNDLVYGFWDEVWSGEYDIHELRQRSHEFVSYWYDGSREIVIDYSAVSLRQDFERYVMGDKSQENEVKGTCACNGKVKGRVCVVTDLTHFDKVKAGDVLVTVMTRPEYLALMRMASAIVTDEGGLTCHAAIVSRELGTPCIIGTKVATKVLRDGDEVEVDANHGIVTKIIN